jgi:RepB DNA-primase from phage plasmid
MKADGSPIWLIVESSPGKRQVWTSVGRRGEVTKDEAHECARLLARRYGGDPGSAKAFQLGRAPGFYNRKSCHRDDKGHYPRVIARGTVSTRIAHDVMAEAREALNAPSPRPRGVPVTMRSSPVYLTGAEFQDAIEHAHRWTEFYDDEGRLWFRFTMPTIRCLEAAYGDVLDYMVEHCGYEPIARGDGHVDRSKQDLAVAQTMLRLGFSHDFVMAVLNVGSEKAQGRSNSDQYVHSTVEAAADQLECWS